MLREELLECISVAEFRKWQILEQVEPFGERADYLRAGIIASTLANIHRDEKKRSKPFKPEDFMPRFDERPEEPKQKPKQMLEMMKLFMLAHNSTVENQKQHGRS